MTRLIEILISLAIVAALMLLVALVLPSSRHLSESVETNRKMTIVFDTINSLRRFTDWNALALCDPPADFELSGPASEIGRAHVCTPVTNAHHVCRLLLEKKHDTLTNIEH